MQKSIDLIYNINTKRFRFKDDIIGILYFREETNTRDNINFKELQKYVRRILKTLHKNNTIHQYDFVVDGVRYNITFEKE